MVSLPQTGLTNTSFVGVFEEETVISIVPTIHVIQSPDGSGEFEVHLRRRSYNILYIEDLISRVCTGLLPHGIRRTVTGQLVLFRYTVQSLNGCTCAAYRVSLCTQKER